MLQKVIIRQDMHGPTAYPITDAEITEMLKTGTAKQVPQNPNIFTEVSPPPKTEQPEDEDDFLKDEDPQTYNTRDVVSEPGHRRRKNPRQRNHNRQISAED